MRKSRFARQLASILVLAMAFAVTGTRCADAQTSTGQIKGVVTDTTGALVPGATVTAVSVETGFTRSTISRADGSFLIPLLEPNHYNLQVTATNFERLVRGPITVQLTETSDVGNLPLTVGSQNLTVTVTGEEALLDTVNSTLGKVFDSTLIEALPLSTRNFTQLLSLQAGVIGSIPGTLALGNGTAQFAVGGNRVYDNSINIDGVNAVSTSSSGAYSIPSPDALQEFKMQTSTYSAEYGRAGGGDVDVTTKSGSNQFHGDGFYFFRNKALDANSYFGKQSQATATVPYNTPADIRQAQWGGTVGGPIKRDKMFFFFSFQSTNQINGNAGLVINPLYPLIPTGDRSNTGVFAAELGAIYAGEPGLLGINKVAADGSNINPVALSILQAKFSNGNYVLPSFPKRDYDNTGRNDISYAYFSLDPTYQEKQYMGNVDYKISARQTLSEKFFDSHTLFVTVNGGVPGFTAQQPGVSDNAVITHTFTISPTLVNEVKLGYLRQFGGSTYNASGFTATEVGMKPAPDAGGAFPQFLIAQDGLIFPNTSGVYGISTENQYSIGDTVSKTIGRHNMRFGGIFLDHLLDSDSRGAGAVFAYQMADFLLGDAGNIFLSAAGTGSFQRNFRLKDVGGFYQDDYKVLPKLTLNLGLRWDYYSWPTETKGRMDNFVASRIGEGAFGIPNADQGYTGFTLSKKFHTLNPNFKIPGGITLVNDKDGLTPNYKNFAPRVGFAWQPEKNTAVRGGFGLFFNRGSTIVAEALVSGPPFNNSDLVVFPAGATLQDPFDTLNLPPDSAYPMWTPRVYNPNGNPGLLFNAANEKVGNPYTEQWNLSIQQQFGNSLLFELAYQGSNGVKLLEALSQNQSGIASPQHPIRGITTNLPLNTPGSLGGPNIIDRAPVVGVGPDEELAVTGTTASSHFNAFEATLNKRLSQGLQFLSAFTWSRNEDSDTVGYGGVGSAAVPPNDNNSTRHMSISGNDRALRFTTSAVYTLPNPFKNRNGFLERSFSGFGLSGVLVAQTGPPISFGISNDTAQTSAVKYDGNLTDTLVPGKRLQDIAGHGPAKNRLQKYFNTNRDADGTDTKVNSNGQIETITVCDPVPGMPSDLACPGPTSFGNLPSNTSLRAPGQKSIDLALTKTTKLFEHYNVEIRADFFNAFNWVNFGGPDSGIIDATFGKIQSTTVDPRVIQASAKFKF